MYPPTHGHNIFIPCLKARLPGELTSSHLSGFGSLQHCSEPSACWESLWRTMLCERKSEMGGQTDGGTWPPTGMDILGTENTQRH